MRNVIQMSSASVVAKLRACPSCLTTNLGRQRYNGLLICDCFAGTWSWSVAVGPCIAIPKLVQCSQQITSSLESQYRLNIHKHQSYVWSAFGDLKHKKTECSQLGKHARETRRLILNFKCKTSSQRHTQLPLDGKRHRWVLLPFLLSVFLLILASSRGNMITVVNASHLGPCVALGGDHRRNIISRFPPPGLFT